VAFNYPVLGILGKNNFELFGIAIAIIIIWFFITNIILKKGLEKYVSTGC